MCQQGQFHKFLNAQDRIHLATAKKGVGKSALIRWIENRVNCDVDPEALVISLTGSDLVRSNFNLTTKLELPNDFIRDWMVRICAIVNRRLGAGSRAKGRQEAAANARKPPALRVIEYR